MKCKRHYVLIQESVRYEICDEKEGEWDLVLQNTYFRLCGAISTYDLVIKMKSGVYRHTAELFQTPLQKALRCFMI